MTALSAAIQRPVRLPVGGLRLEALRLAGYTNHGATYEVYKGAIMGCDASAHDGYFSNVDFTPASGDISGGIAIERQSIATTDTTDGAKKITVARNGVWGFAKGSIAITDIGALVYATTDNDIQTSSTNAMLFGRVVDVDDTYAWIDIEAQFMVPTS